MQQYFLPSSNGQLDGKGQGVKEMWIIQKKRNEVTFLFKIEEQSFCYFL